MKKKPSKLTTLTKRSRNIVNSIIIGDVYDLSNGKNTINRMFEYCTTIESGYIYDKQGNRYDVLCTSEQTDCGRIAGAGMNYQAKINYSGTILSLESYYGIMSKSTGDKIISALREGIYLEDYLQLYLPDVRHEQKDIARQILSQEKPSVIDAIRADREKPRQPSEKNEKAKNRSDDER